MQISLSWLRDYVALPDDLDPRELAERFTITTAEVEGVEEIRIRARGLIAARVVNVSPLPETKGLQLVTLDIGGGKTIETVSVAPVLRVGWSVVYAPPGASVKKFSNIGTSTVAGRQSVGMILPGEALGVSMAVQEAIFVDPGLNGSALSTALFEDDVIEIDNKSITNRPDLWGHYGVAREVAAIYRLPLKPVPLTPEEELADRRLPEVPIEIADPVGCRRYTGLTVEGVPQQPAPLWMQLRLGHVGLRPISGLVDLTNYIMLDLGQPMHAFDAGRVDRIEVDRAGNSEKFRTLDGVERKLTSSDLMIKSRGKNVALAGVMGGSETEVSEQTTALLLESANFDPTTIRKTAMRLGLRTDASARFEKSLDPLSTSISVQRFIQLARPMYPNLKLTGRLSDAYPRPPAPIAVRVDLRHVARTVGRHVSTNETRDILTPLGFSVEGNDASLTVRVPSFRATNDISIEADVIEEIARYVGYNNLEPALPVVAVRRFEPNALHELEQLSLRYLTTAHPFHEIHGYLWYDANWLQQLGLDPGVCVELANPAAAGCHQLRGTLMPGLLAVLVKNRFYFPEVSLAELGSVFETGSTGDREFRHLGLIHARRGKGLEPELTDALKGAVEAWAWDRFARKVSFARASRVRPWEHDRQTAAVFLEGRDIGRMSAIDMALRKAMDEHLTSWSVAWVEIRLSGLETLPRPPEPLAAIPAFPRVELDFSFVVPAATRFADAAVTLRALVHPLLVHLRFIGSFEGASVGTGRRSLTVRALLGRSDRTLHDMDLAAFRASFENHLTANGYELRQ